MSDSESFRFQETQGFASKEELHRLLRYLKHFLDIGTLVEVSTVTWLRAKDSLVAIADRSYASSEGDEFTFTYSFNDRTGLWIQTALRGARVTGTARPIPLEERHDFCGFLRSQLESHALIECTLTKAATLDDPPWLDYLLEHRDGTRYEIIAPDPNYGFFGWYGLEGSYLGPRS